MLSSANKKKYMELAIDQAKEAEKQGEVPIGAVVVDPEGKVIGTGYNRRELDEDATQHAEMIAIKEACHNLGMWRLIDCSLFVTLEPCPMCAGAIINSRIKDVYLVHLIQKLELVDQLWICLKWKSLITIHIAFVVYIVINVLKC